MSTMVKMTSRAATTLRIMVSRRPKAKKVDINSVSKKNKSLKHLSCQVVFLNQTLTLPDCVNGCTTAWLLMIKSEVKRFRAFIQTQTSPLLMLLCREILVRTLKSPLSGPQLDMLR